MWRSILALILLPSLIAAQAEIPTTPQSTNSKIVPTGTSYPEPMYHSHTRWNQIRRGMTEDIAIELAATEYVAWPTHSVPSVLPMNLEIEPAVGFTFKNFRFPKPYVQKFGSQESPVRVVDGWRPMQFSLTASDSVALGEQVLKGRLTFEEVISRTGASMPRQIDIQIPVVVVDHDVKVSKNNDYPWVGISTGKIVLLILLAPVLVLYFIGCGLTFGSPGICQM